jgi:YHS domain-containing protein
MPSVTPLPSTAPRPATAPLPSNAPLPSTAQTPRMRLAAAPSPPATAIPALRPVPETPSTDAAKAPQSEPLVPTQRNAPIERVEAATLDAPAEPWAQPREWKSRRTTSEPIAERPVAYNAPIDGAPLGLDGYCPVELLKTEQWVEGNPALAVEYEGRMYRMSGPEQHRAFRAHPERFAPVLSGFDPVLAAEGRGNVPGRTDACAVYEGKLYMFADQANLSRFRQSPKQYTKFVAESSR